MTTAHSNVAIVVPCYNEATRLPVDAFLAFAKETGVRFVFCNDGSTDETEAVLTTLVARSGGGAEKLSLERNSGKAEAVRRGLLRALETEAEIVGYFDADLATPLEEIPRMAAYFGNQDVLGVTGARVQLHGGHIERRPLRHYAGRIFATAATLALGATYYDTQCGAKLFRRGPVLAEALGAPFSSAWIFDVELLGRLMIGAERRPGQPAIVREHPLERWRDVKGSKVRASTFARAPFELVRLARELQRWRSR